MPRKSTRLKAIEFRLFQRLRKPGASPQLTGRRVLLSCSGGRDSTALAYALSNLSRRLGFELGLVQLHHGRSSDSQLNQARAEARRWVKSLAQELGVRVHCPRPAAFVTPLKSEEELRRYRWAELERIAKTESYDLMVLAHHQDDLLETRLIRLVRGTGPQGLEAMTELRGQVWRPWLTETRAEIERYCNEAKIKWVEDPSNQSTEPLRNWIRQIWLPQLEEKRPGGSLSFSRSLDLIVSSLSTPAPAPSIVSQAEIDREHYDRQAVSVRREMLSRLVRRLGARTFSKAQIDEIRKRIEHRRECAGRAKWQFSLLELHWQITGPLIRASRLDSSLSLALDPEDASSIDH